MQNIEIHFINQSFNAQKLFYMIKQGELNDYSLDKLIRSWRKLEFSIDRGIYLLGECAELMNNDEFLMPNFMKYIDYSNFSLNELEEEITSRF